MVLLGSFVEGRIEDSRNVLLVKSEGTIICSTNKMVRVFSLNDSRFSGHAFYLSNFVPIFPKAGSDPYEIL